MIDIKEFLVNKKLTNNISTNISSDILNEISEDLKFEDNNILKYIIDWLENYNVNKIRYDYGTILKNEFTDIYDNIKSKLISRDQWIKYGGRVTKDRKRFIHDTYELCYNENTLHIYIIRNDVKYKFVIIYKEE